MRQQHYLPTIQQPRVNLWLHLIDIQPRPENLSSLHRIHKRLLIND